MTGVTITALDSYPNLLDVDDFYMRMYRITGGDFNSIVTYCELNKMTKEETLESVEIMVGISNEVT